MLYWHFKLTPNGQPVYACHHDRKVGVRTLEQMPGWCVWGPFGSIEEAMQTAREILAEMRRDKCLTSTS